MTAQPNPEHHASLRIADDHVTVPPRASWMITVYRKDAAPEADPIIESDQRCFATAVSRLPEALRDLSNANPTGLLIIAPYHQVNRAPTIAFLEETQEAGGGIVVAEFQYATEPAFKLRHSFNVNPALSPEERQNVLAFAAPLQRVFFV